MNRRQASQGLHKTMRQALKFVLTHKGKGPWEVSKEELEKCDKQYTLIVSKSDIGDQNVKFEIKKTRAPADDQQIVIKPKLHSKKRELVAA